MNKTQLLEKMEEARFLPISNETFKLYDEFESLYHESPDDPDMLQLHFYKGETYYRLGEYQSAQEQLSKGILKADDESSPVLLANCHNILGLIYVSMGYELVAMENYLLGIDYAKASGNLRTQIIIQINLGWMYRDLGDKETALEYFENCLEIMKTVEISGAYNLWELCLSYIGQIAFMNHDYERATSAMRQVHNLSNGNNVFYEVVAQNMNIRGYSYLNDPIKLQESIDFAIESAVHQEDFLEFSEAYFDICKFLLDKDEDSATRMIKVLRLHCERINLPFLNLKMKELEVQYAEKFCSKQEYLNECALYYVLYQKFNEYDKEYKVKSLASISALQTERKEKTYYQEKSRYDLMTSLLNKVSFSNAVTNMLKSINFEKISCALAIIDIDNFKEINDNYGHSFGDKFITDTASMMRSAFDEAAMLGRIGGDEFAVFWPNANDHQLILSQLENLHELYKLKRRATDIKDFTASVSVGVALSNKPIDFSNLYIKADDALYCSKENGRNQTTIYGENK